MCGFLFTNADIQGYDLDYVLEFLKKRGPDSTDIKTIRGYTFIHTLLSMTGPLTKQPFTSTDGNIICIYNGEIYNFEDFGSFQSDGECLIPLYQQYGESFLDKLDGEFAILVADFNKNILLVSADIFGTRPLWIGFKENKFAVSSYKSCLDRIDITNNFQILANKTYIIDLESIQILEEKTLHTFDLRQFKTSYDDWNTAFAEAIRKRVKYAKCGVFIGMSAGYDSGAIACELTKQNANFTAYSIANVENMDILDQRTKIVKKSEIINISREEFLSARDFLKKNAEEYLLNIDNGEKEKYNKIVSSPEYRCVQSSNVDDTKYTKNQMLRMHNEAVARAKEWADTIQFRKKGQILTDDNGAIGCSYICSRAKINNEKIYLSGSGADEIFSDYGFNKFKFYNHSTIGGHFTEDLAEIFPWKNFFGNTQRAYLMKEEHVAGAHGIEGRYPFLDKFVVQEFLWLSAELKNKNYKAPIDNYLNINNFPYEKNQKTGFGCGYKGPSGNDKSYEPLGKDKIMQNRNTKVTDVIDDRVIDFTKFHKKSFENYCIIEKSSISQVDKNLFECKIKITHPGLKYAKDCPFYILEDEIPIGNQVRDLSKIADEGKGLFCFWTSETLYFSSSDNSNPIKNHKIYSLNSN